MSRTPGLSASAALVGESVVIRDYDAADIWIKPAGVVLVILQFAAGEQWFAASELESTEHIDPDGGSLRLIEVY